MMCGMDCVRCAVLYRVFMGRGERGGGVMCGMYFVILRSAGWGVCGMDCVRCVC
jgi:hypothetical protein